MHPESRNQMNAAAISTILIAGERLGAKLEIDPGFIARVRKPLGSGEDKRANLLAGLAALIEAVADNVCGPEMVKVPDFTKRTEIDADGKEVLISFTKQNVVAELKRVRLSLGSVMSAQGDPPWGTVQIQEPDPGTEVKRGSAVDVVLSQSPTAAELAEKEAKEAEAKAKEADGYIAGEGFIPQDEAPEPKPDPEPPKPRRGRPPKAKE